jgi:endo-cleaving rubber dioxygenase
LLPPLSVDSLFNIGIKQRGQNNAVGAFEFLVTVLDLDSLGLNPNPLKTVVGVTGVTDVAHPLAHTQDTPPWWNMGSRPRKFFDAGVSNDSTRIIMAAGPGEFDELVSADGRKYRDRIEQYDQDLEAFFLSLRSPEWPEAIDTALAEQGAVLFHSKDLWAHSGNADAPRPLGGNGSCASCHGAYSPRYVNDPAYLQTPALEGVAGHISPLNVIGTDAARSDMLTPTLRERWDTTYWGYNDGAANYVAPEDKDPLTEALDDMFPLPLRPMGVCGWEKDVIGYQAPPLYGVWATAPYFHNGSVPTLEQVLDSSRRPAIWQRTLQEENGIKGFDQRFAVAFDTAAVGWKHDALSCTDIPGSALANCNPVDDQGPSLVQMTQNFLNGLVSWTGIVNIPDPSPGAIDKRLVYDTRILGNGNGGHTFSDVLTETERRAIIEYLKTL